MGWHNVMALDVTKGRSRRVLGDWLDQSPDTRLERMTVGAIEPCRGSANAVCSRLPATVVAYRLTLAGHGRSRRGPASVAQAPNRATALTRRNAGS
jgi:hypothetical protein